MPQTNTPKKTLQQIPDIDLVYYFRLLLRHKWFILFFTLLITAITAYITFQIDPIYRASTLIVIDKKSANTLSVNDVIPISTNQKEYISTELQILKSTELAERVVGRLSLDTHPIFDPRQQEEEFSLSEFIKGLITSSGAESLENVAEAKTEEEINQGIFDEVVEEFMTGLSISPIRNTQVVTINYETTNPKLAVEIADTMADVYIESHLQAKLDATTKATNWLNEKLGGLRTNLKNSEQALQDYRDEAGLIDVKGIKTIDSQELTALTQQYVAAKGERYSAETKYRQVQRLGGNPSLNQLMGLPSVLEQPLVQSMNNKKAQADQKVAELNQLFGPKHPSMVAAVSEAQSAERALRQQVNLVVDSIRANYRQAQQNEASLQAQINQTKKRFQTINKQEFKLEDLEREVETNKQIYSLFLTRAKESDDAGQLRVPHARVIDFAKATRDPIKPRWKLIIALALILSSIIAIAWVFIRDMMDKSFHTIYDIEDKLHMSVLGKVPLIKQLKTKGGQPFKGFMSEKDPDFTESIRTLRTSFIVSSLDNPYKTSIITSSVPNEGKSTISVNFAEALGLMEKTLLVDVDLRRAELTKSLGINLTKPGLTDILTGKIQYSDAIVSISEHVDFIPAGTNLYYALENISSNKMKELLSSLSKKYDRILLDTPPVHAVSDAVALSKIVDCVVFVVKADSTKINVAKRAIQTLLDMDANISGVILNGVDKEKEKMYGGYDSGYGYGYEQPALK